MGSDRSRQCYRRRGALACGVAFVLLAASGAASATDWPQFGFDASHSDNNTAETAISRDNLVYLVVDYQVQLVPPPAMTDAPPVYAGNISTPSGPKNLLFFDATDSLIDGISTIGYVIAVDAADGTLAWVQTTTGSGAHASSSPAIDPDRDYVYAAGLDGYVHKYRIGDGAEITTAGPVGWPALVTLKPSDEKIASGLTIVRDGDSSYLIAVTDGYNGDGGDYQGHVTSIDLATGAQRVFNAMCSGVPAHLGYGACAGLHSGIWGRGGATFDAGTGRIYVTTGNGHFDANDGGFDWGDSVLALAPDAASFNGQPLDSFTPVDYEDLDMFDEDLGSNSLAVVPTPQGCVISHLGLQVGKDGTGYLLNLDDLSGMGGPANVGGELQDIGTQPPFDMTIQPGVWVDPEDGSTWVYTSGIAWQLVLDGSGMPSLVKRWNGEFGPDSPVLANGLLFSASGGLLRAIDARTGELLHSISGAGAQQHWQSVIVVDGAIYAIDGESVLTRFVPRPHIVTPTVNDANAGTIDPAEPQTVADGDYLEFVMTPSAHHVLEFADGCYIHQDDDGRWYTGQIFEDCTVLAYFGVDPADVIFEDGFDAGAR
jgi:hypothetical protein